MDSELYISNAEYHSDTTRISKSGLDEIAKSPAHYYHAYLSSNRQRKTTQALIDGSAVHTAILEPSLFTSQFLVEPRIDKRSNKGKELYEKFLAAANGRTLISPDTYEMAMRMKEAVLSQPIARELLSVGMPEQTILWEDPITGARCKCRPDFRTPDGIVIDLKTTEDASPEAFGRSAFKYRYYVQAPFYRDGLVCAGRPFKAFAFLAVEKSPPYQVAIYYADDKILSLGTSTYRRDLETYVACLKSNKWPGYGEEATPLRLPEWAYKQ